jgi:hypothetical protein
VHKTRSPASVSGSVGSLGDAVVAVAAIDVVDVVDVVADVDVVVWNVLGGAGSDVAIVDVEAIDSDVGDAT